MTRYFRIACLGLAVAASPALAGEPWQGVYEGVIGSARVIVALAPEGARYVHVGRPNDLGLIVTAKGNDLEIVETVTPNIGADEVKTQPRLVSGGWALRLAGEKLTGSRIDLKSAGTRTVSLTRVSNNVENADFTGKPGRPGAYGARWLASTSHFLPMGKEASFGPISYTLLRDDLYGNAMPRLTRAPKGVRIEAVNRALESLHRDLVLQDRDCAQALRSSVALTDFTRLAATEKDKDTGVSQGEITVTYASDSLFALEEGRSTFCGGAHPNAFIHHYTFDLGGARQITGVNDAGKQDLGPSGLGAALDIADASKKARFDAFWVGKFRASLEKIKVLPAAGKDDQYAGQDCAQALDSDLQQNGAAISASAYPTPKGLAILATGFPHALQICSISFEPNPLVIPYAELRPFLKPGQHWLPIGQ